jgi:hypothetical protein
MIRTILALLMAAALLAGCGSMMDSFTFLQTKEKPIPRDIMPANFKQEIMNTVPSVVSEQRGIREAYYSDPMLDPKVNTYASCVRFNARDSSGVYEGAKEYAIYYYGGHLNQFVAADDGQCKAVNYKPFPELERLCPGGKCS